jgi:phosphate transport system permease protein
MSSATVDRATSPPRSVGDRVFARLVSAAAIVILVTLAGVAIFLTVEGLPGITASAENFPGADTFIGYVWPLLFGTLLSSALAMLFAVPLAIGVALFISHYAPRQMATSLGYVIDLLAAVPSIIYGLWGFFVLADRVKGPYAWLANHLSFIPFFAGPASPTGRTILTVGLVLAVMVLPLMTSICREIFLQTPRLHEEAAIALGATTWETVRMTVFPYARSGIVSGAMLALGRALGETIAVATILSVSGVVTFNLISSTNPGTIAANIALQFPEASGAQVNVLVATGLVLFVLTFAVNFIARWIVGRRSEFSGAN